MRGGLWSVCISLSGLGALGKVGEGKLTVLPIQHPTSFLEGQLGFPSDFEPQHNGGG